MYLCIHLSSSCTLTCSPACSFAPNNQVSSLRASSPRLEPGVRLVSGMPWHSDRFFAKKRFKTDRIARDPPARQVGRVCIATWDYTGGRPRLPLTSNTGIPFPKYLELFQDHGFYLVFRPSGFPKVFIHNEIIQQIVSLSMKTIQDHPCLYRLGSPREASL